MRERRVSRETEGIPRGDSTYEKENREIGSGIAIAMSDLLDAPCILGQHKDADSYPPVGMYHLFIILHLERRGESQPRGKSKLITTIFFLPLACGW